MKRKLRLDVLDLYCYRVSGNSLSWTFDRRKLCLILGFSISFLLFGPSSMFAQNIRSSGDADPIKISTTLVYVPIVANGSDRDALTQITKEDVLITSAGVEHEIAFFSSSNQRLSVAIVIDTSGSVEGIWRDILGAAQSFVRSLNESDRATVVTFDDKVKIRSPLTNEKKRVESAIRGTSFVPGGIGLMNEALLKILEGEFGKTEDRKAIIVITDAGEIDPNSYPRLRDRLIQGDTLVYPIYFQTSWNWPRFKKSLPFDEVIKLQGADSLFDIAKVTGGRFILAEKRSIRQEFESIIDELSRYYVVGFYAEPEIGRDLRIASKREGVVFRTKSLIRPSIKTQRVP